MKGKFKSIVVFLLVSILIGSMVGCNPTSEPTGMELELNENQQESIQMLSSTDALGREVTPQKGEREKLVGLFYLLWCGQEVNSQLEIYDTSKMDLTPGSDFWDYNASVDNPILQFHYWGEPLYGYYDSQDPFVMRRHVELLTMAGIDFLAFDSTNLYTYDPVWKQLLQILQEYYDQGWDVPKIVFYTHSESKNRVKYFYNVLYRKNYCPDTWLRIDGKPVIIADESEFNTDNSLDKTIKEFFTFKNYQWPNENPRPNSWPWMDFQRPQHNYDGAMNVSVSQAVSGPFSDSVQYPERYNKSWGRGYTTENGNDKNKILEGANFQEQWDHAIETDPELVFITSWNEWIAVKFGDDFPPINNAEEGLARRVFMWDCVNLEFSRDIEMMKGGYGDNYYLQMMANIRKYKGIERTRTDGEGTQKSIDINGKIADEWSDVMTSYRDFAGDTVIRDFKNAAKNSDPHFYTDNSARNDIVETRVAEDEQNLYFLVTCNDAITKHEEGDQTWMTLYLGIEEQQGPAFDSYQYIVNRNPNGENVTSLERSVGGYSYETIGEVGYVQSGNHIVFSVPKNLLGINGEYTLRLKVTDHITHPDDIMDYYVSGDSAPIGRLSYTYYGG